MTPRNMYVEAKPLSTYGETSAWKMPSPKPARTLRRPPMLQKGSSSSLSGMEQSVPSFRNFVKRTPPPGQYKPLPPTPLRPRRASSFTDGSHRPSSSSQRRRSSSVYSRTVSQWGTDENMAAWEIADSANQNNMLLRPLAYSGSTSQSVSSQPISVQSVLEPRTYKPLILTPSPTVTRFRTPSPLLPESRSSLLLPTPPASVRIPKKHLRTVSLEKAKETINAPGAVHLLPEELRAKTLAKSRSQDPLRVPSMAIFAGETPMSPPMGPTLLDNRGRELLARLSQAPMSPQTRIWKRSKGSHEAGSTHQAAPLTFQPRKESRAKAAQALGLDNSEEVRGRQMTRGPRDPSYKHYLPKATRLSDSSNEEQTDAQRIAQEYHDMLSQQYRTFAESPASRQTNRSGSDTDVRSEMKMIPQPLFHGKPPAKLQSSIDEHERVDSSAGSSFLQHPSRSRSSLLSRLATSSNSLHRRRSTSGSIPISPPSEGLPAINQVSQTPPAKPRPTPRARRNSSNAPVSAYYPYVMSRSKQSKTSASRKKRVKRSDSAQPAGPPLMLAADIIAEREKTPESMYDALPPGPLATHLSSDADSDENATSEEASKPLHQSILKDAVTYADLLTRPADYAEKRKETESLSTEPIASPDSPHLLPSPTSSVKSPRGLHLGWSDVAKSSFDKARSSVQPSARSGEPLVTHHITPARPLDESKTALEESEMPTRRGSIFTSMMDGWRENKAQKRREELKKIIKVVTPAQV